MKAKIKVASATKYLDSIHRDSKIYASIIAPQEAKWEKEERELRGSLIALSIFLVAQVLPLALSLMRLYRSEIISLASAKKSFLLLEKFTFQFNAIAQSRGGGGIAGMYAKLAQDANKCESSQQFAIFLNELKSKLAGKVPDLDEFSVGFSRLLFRSEFTRDRALIRYILRKFSERYGLPTEVDGTLYTIEHILPESQWETPEEMFGLAAIGNLLFVPEAVNQKLKAKPFKQKKQILLENSVPMDPFLAGSNKWGLDKEVVERTAALAETAHADIWRI